jgi:endoglucanase
VEARRLVHPVTPTLADPAANLLELFMKIIQSHPLLLAALALACFGCGPAINDAKAMAQTPEGAPCGPDALIEDGEDNNNQVIVHDGRAGYIYTYMDPEGTTITPKAGSDGGVFSMTAGGVNGSGYAMRMSGQMASAKVVYAGMGLNLTDPKDTYDATRYKGVSFYAKRGPGTTRKVRVKIPDVNTDPDGGLCGNCYNDFGLIIKLEEEWQQYVVPFSKLRQESGWGSPRPGSVAVDKMFAIQWQVKDPGVQYDIWVDDVAFTGCSGK